LNFAVLDHDVFLDPVGAVVMVVVFWLLLAVEDAVGCAVQAVAEAVVVPVFVVISHVNAVLAVAASGWINGTLFGAYVDFLVEDDRLTLSVALLGIVARVCALVLPTTLGTVLLGERSGALTVVALGYVKTTVEVDLGGGRVTGVVLAVVDAVLDVDLGVGVALVRLTVAVQPWSISEVLVSRDGDDVPRCRCKIDGDREGMGSE
jgi:hypothetical protein